jgi:hypothetical protein
MDFKIFFTILNATDERYERIAMGIFIYLVFIIALAIVSWCYVSANYIYILYIANYIYRRHEKI